MSEANLDLFARPGGPAPRIWSVRQVNRAAQLLLEESMPRLWIRGEVANFTRHGSGHCYFSLKDRWAQLRCVMFRSEAAALPALPENGMTLRAFGGLTVYVARGSYQFKVDRLEAESEGGMWKLAFERLQRRLEAEGLTDAARKRDLPRFPRTLGVVTSPTGAALRDIVAVTRRRAPWLRLVVGEASVQGRGAADEIAAAIRRVAERGADVVIVARGGGSIEDLWCFNEEPVARAVAACPVPVVSGVGHETDVTICDLVADVRAATPSAAAEAAAPDGVAVGRRLDALDERLRRALARSASARRERVEWVAAALGESVERLVRTRAEHLARQGPSLAAAIRLRLAQSESRVRASAAAMEALSPLSTLSRGYAVPLDERGRLLRAIDDFVPARPFDLRVADGSVPCAATGAGAPADPVRAESP